MIQRVVISGVEFRSWRTTGYPYKLIACPRRAYVAPFLDSPQARELTGRQLGGEHLCRVWLALRVDPRRCRACCRCPGHGHGHGHRAGSGHALGGLAGHGLKHGSLRWGRHRHGHGLARLVEQVRVRGPEPEGHHRQARHEDDDGPRGA